MEHLTDDLTKTVLARLNCKDARDFEIISKLVKHVHAFVRDLKPTEEEWLKAIQFLTRTGQICTDKRQEFILFSDVLGVSMLVDSINHSNQSSTETTVTGPFHAPARNYAMGMNIATGLEAERGETTVVRGKIIDENNNPIQGATIDVWQSDDIGYYDTQDEKQPKMNLRGIFTTDKTGEYWFKTIKPAPYPIPTDGPVGELLRMMGRHPMRPAHIHFWIKANGYRQIITHLFVKGDEYLQSDAVFGVKESLILDFILNHDHTEAKRLSVKSPFYDVNFDFQLAKQ